MKITAEMHYPALPETVFTMICDTSFQERLCEATGALAHEVSIESDGEAVSIRSTRTMPTDDIPDFVRSFVGPTLDVVRADRWEPARADGSRRGTVSVEIHGTPVRLTGTLSLSPDDGGTRQLVEGDLKASVPLVGGKVERAAEPAVMAAIRKEEQIGLLHLGG